jgi:TonB family protein
MPAVQEETRTVIVFPDGAVIRMSAALNTGELVVLRNQRSGADVICRVVSVKAQPGIQNYVELEFTQRAPGFWGDQSPTNTVQERPAGVGTILPKIPALVMPSASRMDDASQVASREVDVHDARPVELPASRNKLASVQRVSEVLQPSIRREATFGAVPALGSDKASLNKPLIAIAAVVLLAGAGIGVWYLRSGNRAAEPAPVADQRAPADYATPTQQQVPGTETEEASVVPAVPPAPVVLSNVPARPELRNAERELVEAQPKLAAPAPKGPDPRKVLMAGNLVAPTVRKAGAETPTAPPALPADVAAPALGDNLLLAASGGQGLVASAPVAPSRTAPQRVEAKLIYSPPPIYPQAARISRIEGDVTIESLVDQNGQVKPLKVISGHPLLQQAAMNAVRGWKYQPARFNGEPIAIQLQIRVSFRLQQ